MALSRSIAQSNLPTGYRRHTPQKLLETSVSVVNVGIV